MNIFCDDNSLLSQLVQAFVYVCSCSLHDTKFHSRVVIMSSSVEVFLVFQLPLFQFLAFSGQFSQDDIDATLGF